MNAKARLYFRTVRFVSMHWCSPFFLGIATSLAIVTYVEVSILEALGEAFDQSFKSVIQSCAM